MNIFQKAITPDMPRVLEGEQIYVYVPQATSTNAGIASYKNADFKVNDGVVSLRRELRDAYNIPDLVLLDERHFPREIVEKDGNEYYKYTTNAILHIVQNLSDQQKQQARENIDAGSKSDISKMNTDLIELKNAISKQVLSVNGKHGHVILKNSDIENDTNYATVNFVNSSIATNTATFRGTFNSLIELQEYDGHKDINDYAFVIETDSVGNIKYNRYKYAEDKWIFEYTLNNSSFTQTQWDAINSGINANKIIQITNEISNKANRDELPIIDSEISPDSINPVQNKAIAKALEGVQASITMEWMEA